MFDDSFDADIDDEEWFCAHCGDASCPGCGPSIASRLIKLGLALLGVLVLVAISGAFVSSGDQDADPEKRLDSTPEVTALPQPSSSTEPPTPPTAPPTAPPETTSTPQPVIEPSGNPTAAVVSSVVQVVVFAGSDKCGWGSGTVVVDSATVVTNQHVVASSPDCNISDIEVWTVTSLADPPEPTYRATVRAVDQVADLAILMLEPLSADAPALTPVPIGDTLDVGEDIFTLGFPNIGGTSITIAKGVASGITRLDGVEWIKTDASITGGSSGGTAVNTKGELIGVPTMASISQDGEVVDCRNVADTNRDGQVDKLDTCQPIGGFLNLLSPSSRVRQLLDRVTASSEANDSNTSAILPWASTPDGYADGVIDTDNESTVRAAWKSTLANGKTPIEWTGSTGRCQAGTTSDQFKIAVLDRVQWYRAMAGVDPRIRLDESSNRYAQAAALVMAANYDLSHEPDSSWQCFSDEAYEGASHSNLHLGYFGPKAIDSYIEDDGSDNGEVGHRRWILDPSLLTIGTGDTTTSNALWVINESERSNPLVREASGFVMWPPRGFVPRSTIHERWSISHPTANFSSVTVEVSVSGRTYEVTDVLTSEASIGSSNAIVFEWQRPPSGTKEVTVVIRDIEVSGSMRDLSYVVKPID